jgi:hypothetical protein
VTPAVALGHPDEFARVVEPFQKKDFSTTARAVVVAVEVTRL